MSHEMVVLDDVSRVTDYELVIGLRRLVRADQSLNAQLLVHLGEVDARGLYREHAYPSMFAYCVEGLCMSEAQAYLRIHAARLGRQFPRILQLVAQGALHLSAIKLLGPHLTWDNHAQLLEQARGKGKREVEQLVAAIAPKPDVPNRIRKLPEPSCSGASRAVAAQVGSASFEMKQPALVLETSSPIDVKQSLSGDLKETPAACAEQTLNALAGVNPSRASFVLEAPRPRSASTPLSPGRYKVEFTAGQALYDKLEQLKDLLRHQVPDGELAALVERAVDLLIEHTMKRRFAQTRSPRMRGTPGQHTTESGKADSSAPDKNTLEPRNATSSAPDKNTLEPRNATSSAPDQNPSEQLTLEQRNTQSSTRARHPDEQHAACSNAPDEHAAWSSTTGPRGEEGRNRAAADDALAHSTGGTRSLGRERGCSQLGRTKSSLAASGAPASSRYIPLAVVREVHRRDSGQCTFVSADGKRCSERGFLELHHHDRPFARGGEATVANLRLVCRAHNALFAERDFGRGWMRSKLAHTREARGALAPERAFEFELVSSRKDA